MVVTFWSLYLYDRELVYPKLLDNFIPQWLNHGMVSSCSSEHIEHTWNRCRLLVPQSPEDVEGLFGPHRTGVDQRLTHGDGLMPCSAVRVCVCPHFTALSEETHVCRSISCPLGDDVIAHWLSWEHC